MPILIFMLSGANVRFRKSRLHPRKTQSSPTVRLRLDRLIQKIRLGEQADEEPYIALIKRLAVKDKLDFDTAKLLINEYKKLREGNK